MEQQQAKRSLVQQVICLTIIGLGVGWLVGMSVSPVVSIVITSLTATAAAVVAVLSGTSLPEGQAASPEEEMAGGLRRGVDPLPVAALVLGIILGSAVGLAARNYGWLGTDLDLEVHKWAKYGLDRQAVANRLYESAYPLQGGQDAVGSDPIWIDERIGVLFGSSAKLEAACISLLELDGADLRRFASGSTIPIVQQLADLIEDPDVLRAVLEVICTQE